MIRADAVAEAISHHSERAGSDSGPHWGSAGGRRATEGGNRSNSLNTLNTLDTVVNSVYAEFRVKAFLTFPHHYVK